MFTYISDKFQAAKEIIVVKTKSKLSTPQALMSFFTAKENIDTKKHRLRIRLTTEEAATAACTQ